MRKTYHIIIISIFALAFAACNKSETIIDAYGNFEADEILVSAEASGKIIELNLNEGDKLNENEIIGKIDASIPTLQLQEIEAQRKKINAAIKSINAQIAIVKQQQENLEVDLKRIENLKTTGAATQKQLDDVTGQLKVIDKQLEAYNTQKAATRTDIKVLDAKASLISEQINKCKIKNPANGTVIEKYAEKGEVTGAGKPVYKLANLDNIILRAYVSGAQLYSIKIGQSCKVYIDKNTDESIEYSGTINWIASQAEFTPKIIQTKDERINMVYAIKVLVKNDGKIKMGMPGEVKF